MNRKICELLRRFEGKFTYNDEEVTMIVPSQITNYILINNQSIELGLLCLNKQFVNTFIQYIKQKHHRILTLIEGTNLEEEDILLDDGDSIAINLFIEKVANAIYNEELELFLLKFID